MNLSLVKKKYLYISLQRYISRSRSRSRAKDGK